jgi:anti-sigma regulatory factor (Ser/Thr protein kinase)
LRELSLHILDLIENAVTAGASRIAVEITQETEWNLMRIMVEDDGPGLSVSAETAMDPFYTTKKGKKTGLGLSLFRFRIEQAGGELTLDRSSLGGLMVRATMSLVHVDRNPLGDLASTISSVMAANPRLELSLRIRINGRERVIDSSEVTRQLAAPDGSARSAHATDEAAVTGLVTAARPLSVARQMYWKIKAGLEALQIKE